MTTDAKPKLIFTQDELPQGSPEWHRFYDATLGGSETACLMFAAYRKTIDSLWEEKVAARRGVVTLESPEGDADRQANMDRGNRLEPLARSTYEKGRYSRWDDALDRFVLTVEKPCKVDQMCMVHPEMQFLRTSLDGIKRNHRVIQEFKCPKDLKNHDRFTKAAEMPAWRYPQVQHQLGVVAAHFPQVERVDYVSFYVEEKDGQVMKTNMRVIPVYPDWEYINELFRRAKIFMGYVAREERPPVNLFREGHKLIARVKQPKKPTNKHRGEDTWMTTNAK